MKRDIVYAGEDMRVQCKSDGWQLTIIYDKQSLPIIHVNALPAALRQLPFLPRHSAPQRRLHSPAVDGEVDDGDAVDELDDDALGAVHLALRRVQVLQQHHLPSDGRGMR